MVDSLEVSRYTTILMYPVLLAQVFTLWLVLEYVLARRPIRERPANRISEGE